MLVLVASCLILSCCVLVLQILLRLERLFEKIQIRFLIWVTVLLLLVAQSSFICYIGAKTYIIVHFLLMAWGP